MNNIEQKKIVSAVLHLGKTDKKKYRKKSSDTIRLCADDVMTRNRQADFACVWTVWRRKSGFLKGVMNLLHRGE